MSAMSRLFFTSAMLLASMTASALEGPAYSPPPPVSTGSLVQITFSLLMVLACIVAVAWLLRRMNLAQQGTGNLLKVIGSVAIGQRERVVLIEVNDTWLLVGVGPGQIRTLHQMEKSEDWQSDAAPLAASDNKFANMLTSMLKSRTSDSKHNAS